MRAEKAGDASTDRLFAFGLLFLFVFLDSTRVSEFKQRGMAAAHAERCMRYGCD